MRVRVFVMEVDEDVSRRVSTKVHECVAWLMSGYSLKIDLIFEYPRHRPT